MEVCFISNESITNDEVLPAEVLTTDEAILAELKLIREGLVKPEEEPEEEEKKRFFRRLTDEFILFIKKYKVFGVAVAFIMALYTGALIQSIVDDLLLPLLEFIPQLNDWTTLTLGPLKIGFFISAVITFTLVSFVVFIIVKIAGKIGIDE
ncbi:MAG: MscL family protein [Candidatus Heimdallarchaeota archaeon]